MASLLIVSRHGTVCEVSICQCKAGPAKLIYITVFKFDVEGSVPHQLYDITVWGASISHHLTEYAHVQPIAKPKANEFVAKCCVVGDRVICGNT